MDCNLFKSAGERTLRIEALSRYNSDELRDHFNSLLPKLDGVNKVIGLQGEIWSPRKVLRRALWHERDHAEHIRKLL